MYKSINRLNKYLMILNINLVNIICILSEPLMIMHLGINEKVMNVFTNIRHYQ